MSNMKRICIITASLMLVALTFLGCVPQEEIISIQVGKNITSLVVGEGEETIEVQALTDKGKSVPFTVETEGDCVSVSSAEDAFTIVAGMELCEQTITVKSGSTEEKTINVIVYDPMAMDIGDGLLIRYVNEYEYMWDDRGSGGSYDVTFWHPKTDTQNGWYPLGSLILNHYGDVSAIPMVVVKDSKDAGLLKAPIGYKKIWDDYGTGVGGGKWLGVWKAVCPDPDHFVAFGVVANNVYVNGKYQEPSLDATRCVKKEYTAPASIGDWVYNDSGTGKTSGNLDVYSIGYPEYTKSPDGRAALLTGVGVACPNYGKEYCDATLFNLLLVPLPVYTSSENITPPRLTGPEPLDPSPRYFSSMRVPFTLIPSEYNEAAPVRVKINIEKSPFYYVQREETYLPVNIVNNTQNPNAAEYNYVITTGFEESESKKFSQEVGVEVTAKGDISFFGSGGGWEVKVSTKFGWERAVARTYSEVITRDFTFTVPARTYAEIVQVTSQFRAIPMTDSIISQSEPFDMDSNIIMYLQYPP